MTDPTSTTVSGQGLDIHNSAALQHVSDLLQRFQANTLQEALNAPAEFISPEIYASQPAGTDDGGPSSNDRCSSEDIAASLNTKKCNCKKAKCLKLYCVCFSAGVYCNGCPCRDCMNTTAHEDIVLQEKAKILQRSPNAFAPKVEQRVSGSVAHKKGCRCRKSRCLKKYCECYDANVHCSSMCRCDDCHNRGTGVGVVPGSLRGAVAIKHEEQPSTPSPQEALLPPCSNSNQGDVNMETAMTQQSQLLQLPAVAQQQLPQLHPQPPAGLTKMQDMILAADLKPTNTLPSETYSQHAPEQAGASIPNSRNASPPPQSQPAPGLQQRPLGNVPTTSALAAAAVAGPLAVLSNDESSMFMVVPPVPKQAVASQQQQQDVAGSKAMASDADDQGHAMLAESTIVSDPEYAQLIAKRLGMDATHQKAVQKAAHIVKSLISLAKDHPLDVATLKDLQQQAIKQRQNPTQLPELQHGTATSHSLTPEQMAVYAVAPPQPAHNNNKLPTSLSTPVGLPPSKDVVMLPSTAASKPPPTSSSGGTSLATLPQRGGVMRLGSGSFRFSGTSTKSESGRPCSSADAKPCNSGPQQASGGANGTTLRRHGSLPTPASMEGKVFAAACLPWDSAASTQQQRQHQQQQNQQQNQQPPLSRSLSLPLLMPTTSGCEDTATAATTSGAGALDDDGTTTATVTVVANVGPAISSRRSELQRGIKRPRRYEDGDDGSFADAEACLEVCMSAEKAAACGLLMSPGKLKGRRAAAHVQKKGGDVKIAKAGSVDTLDSLNEIEALQALFDLGRGSS